MWNSPLIEDLLGPSSRGGLTGAQFAWATLTAARKVIVAQGKAVHRVEQFAGHLGHLLGGSGELGRAGSRRLHKLAHPLHGLYYGAGSGRLLFDGRVDLVGNF